MLERLRRQAVMALTATRPGHELAALRAEFGAVRAEFQAARDRFQVEMDALRAELHAERAAFMAALEELKFVNRSDPRRQVEELARTVDAALVTLVMNSGPSCKQE